MERLRVVTLCSGYDAQCLALERLRACYVGFDYELVSWALLTFTITLARFILSE